MTSDRTTKPPSLAGMKTLMSNDLVRKEGLFTTLSALLKRYSRGVEYLIHWLVFEKPRGLDFSMRVKSIEVPGYHGYALTSRNAFRNILRDLPIGRDDSFLDIGCGKGGVLCYASEMNFGRIGGIEIDLRLVGIAGKNIERLRLAPRVEVMHADAISFDGYEEYNFFYLFNPFDSEIYELVITKILQCIDTASSRRTIWLLCYGASSDAAIKRSNLFDLYRDEICPHRGNSIRIWKSK